MLEPLENAARRVIEYLDTHGHRYAIVGGIALSYWGVPRATYDVDIKLMVPNNDYQAIRAELIAAFPRDARPHLPAHSLVLAVMVQDTIVDFLMALPGYDELVIERAVQQTMGSWTAWICTAEDLIVQKAIAQREKDWLDIESLLIEQSGKLDQVYVREWLEQFAEVLEQPQVLSEYERLLKKTSKLRG